MSGEIKVVDQIDVGAYYSMKATDFIPK